MTEQPLQEKQPEEKDTAGGEVQEPQEENVQDRGAGSATEETEGHEDAAPEAAPVGREPFSLSLHRQKQKKLRFRKDMQVLLNDKQVGILKNDDEALLKIQGHVGDHLRITSLFSRGMVFTVARGGDLDFSVKFSRSQKCFGDNKVVLFSNDETDEDGGMDGAFTESRVLSKGI